MPVKLRNSLEQLAAGEVRPRRRVFEFRATQQADTTRISGHASVWGSLNSWGEVFVPDVFLNSLAKKSASKPFVMGLYHECAIGRWTDFMEDQVGLLVDGPISDTSDGRDAATLARDGVLTGLSIGFMPLVYQFASPGERVTFETSQGTKSYQFDEYVIYMVEAEVVEASLVIAPADDEARLTEVRSALGKARKALPAVAGDDASWEDAAYSMALLMGGRGAAAFEDLPDPEHHALYQRVAEAYERHGKTAPDYERHPQYRDIDFRHDEREVFHDRYLRKTLDSVAAGTSGVTGPLSAETRDAAQRAVQSLTPLLEEPADRDSELQAMASELTQLTRSLKGETTDA